MDGPDSHKSPFASNSFGRWDEAAALAESLGPGWMFRGQACSSWSLTTSFERVVKRFDVPFDENLRRIEKDFLTKFRRNIHLHLANPPPENDDLDSLALMQHHGAPTRLLDWTYSFPVAAYFAIESACPKHGCAIWAVHYYLCNEWAGKMLKKRGLDTTELKDRYAVQRPELFNKFFRRTDEIPLVYQVTPFRLSQRLIIQHGTFLWPGDLSKPFETNLLAFPDARSKSVVRRMVIPGTATVVKNVIESLSRMKINHASLFPGLDGFARSFATELPFEWRRR
jgi:hypothetical protein